MTEAEREVSAVQLLKALRGSPWERGQRAVEDYASVVVLSKRGRRHYRYQILVEPNNRGVAWYLVEVFQ
jgi:hypothetical protein